MKTPFTPRRGFLKITAAGIAGAVLAPNRATPSSTAKSSSVGKIKLGVASYSLRAFSRADAIKNCARLLSISNRFICLTKARPMN